MLNETKFRGIYDDFLASGLTINDYCATQHMYEAKSFYWQNKLKGQLPPKRGFIPVVFGNEPQASRFPSPVKNLPEAYPNTPANQTICCEINYPNGVRVKLEGVSNPEMLRSLLLLTYP